MPVSSSSPSRLPSSSLLESVSTSQARPPDMVRRRASVLGWAMRPNTAFSPKVMTASMPSRVVPIQVQLPSRLSSWR
jgi:hypothetical protein